MSMEEAASSSSFYASWGEIESELPILPDSTIQSFHAPNGSIANNHDDDDDVDDAELFKTCWTMSTSPTRPPTALPPLEIVFPAVASKTIHVKRGVIRTLRYPKLVDVWQQKKYPFKANFILEDLDTNETYDVIAKMNGIEPDLVELDAYVSIATITSGRDTGKHSLVYIQVHPRPVYRDNYERMIQCICDRHVAEHALLGRSDEASGGLESTSELKEMLDLFQQAANELPWIKTTESRPMDLLWWLRVEYEKRTKWAVMILDSSSTALLWISYLCPEALLMWKADAIIRLSLGQLMDLKYQLVRYGWADVFFRKTWVSSTFASSEKHVLDVRTYSMLQHDDGEGWRDMKGGKGTRYQRRRTGIRHEDAHPLDQVTYELMDQIHKHWPIMHGPMISVGTPTRLKQDDDDYVPGGTLPPSFDPILIVLLRTRLTPRQFERLAFLDVFEIFLRPSTMIPLGHPTSLFSSIGPKARLIKDPSFVKSISMPMIRASFRCEARYFRLLRLYLLVYTGTAGFKGQFDLTPRDCSLYLSEMVTAGYMTVWFTHTPVQMVFVMTREALENAVFLRHSMVRFTVQAEERRKAELVTQFVDMDHPFIKELHPLQRSIIDAIQSTTNPMTNIVVVGIGGSGKTTIAGLLDLVEHRNHQTVKDLSLFNQKPLPRLINTHSPITGQPYVWYALKEPSLRADALRLQRLEEEHQQQQQQQRQTTSSVGEHQEMGDDDLMAAYDSFEQQQQQSVSYEGMPNLESLPNITTYLPPLVNVNDGMGLLPDHQDSMNQQPTEEFIQLVRTGNTNTLMLTPTRSTAHDSSRKFNMMAKTFAYLQTKVGFGLTKQLKRIKCIIEDEYSQQGSDAATGIMRALLQMDAVVNIKLGDLLQLDPVAPGNQLIDLYEMLDSYRTRVALGKRNNNNNNKPEKSIQQVLEDDDLDYVCQRSLLVELTHNHRVHSEASDLLQLIDMIRLKRTDELETWQSPYFATLPLAHPERGYFDSDLNISFSAEDRRFIELYDKYKDTPSEYQIIVGTNDYRHLVNALIAKRAGFTFELKENIFSRSGGAGVTDARGGGKVERMDREDGVIKPGSLRIKRNMKLMFRNVFRQDRQKMDSNTIYVALEVINVPESMLSVRCLLQQKHQQQQQQQHQGPGGSSVVPQTISTSNFLQDNFSVEEEEDEPMRGREQWSLDVLSILKWKQVIRCKTVEESSDIETPSSVRCVVLRNLKAETDLIGDDIPGAATFFIVRCTPSLYFQIDLGYAVTSYFMQGLAAPHIHFVMERSYPTHQKLLNTAAGRASRSVTIYVQNSSTSQDARKRMIDAVQKNAPERYTALWLVLHDRLDVTFRTLDKLFL